MDKNCYLCNSSSNKVIFVEHNIPIVQCLSCEHVFSTYEQKDHYDGYWDDDESYDLEWWDKAHRSIYKNFINNFLVKEQGMLLDVGCGLGFFVKTVMKEKPNWNVIGYEMSEKAVDFAINQNRLDNIYAGQVEKSSIQPNSVDVITLWDVIEHIPKPQPLLLYLNDVLKPGGFLFLQTPNFPIQFIKAKMKLKVMGMKDNVHYLEAKDHINNYKKETLNQLAMNCNFENVEYAILPPILSVAGSHSLLGRFFKLSFYYFTKIVWILTVKKVMLNNTLFAILKKSS